MAGPLKGTIQAGDIYPGMGNYAPITEAEYDDGAHAAAEAAKSADNIQMYSVGNLQPSHYVLGLVGTLIVAGYLQQSGILEKLAKKVK